MKKAFETLTKIVKKMIFWFGVFWTSVFFCLGLFVAYVAYRIPSEEVIKGCLVTTMFEVDLCPGSKSYVPLSQISKNMQRAVIAAEDSTFYSHKGFDWEALEKSARENLEKGVYKRGGSTITQQLAKNMFLSRSKSLFRKFLEALITIKIERTLTKNEILERYLNVVEFGPKTYGIKAASQLYFKKSPSQLGVVESAFLTMLLPNPIKYSRSFQMKSLTGFARKRINAIVRSLYRGHKISEGEYQAALLEVNYFFDKNPPPRLQISDEDLARAQEDENDEDIAKELDLDEKDKEKGEEGQVGDGNDGESNDGESNDRDRGVNINEIKDQSESEKSLDSGGESSADSIPGESSKEQPSESPSGPITQD